MMKNILVALFATCLSLAAVSQGYFLEYKLSGAKEGLIGNMKIHAMNNNSRTEMNFTGGGIAAFMPKGLAALYLGKSPDKIFMLNPTEKTYTEILVGDDSDWSDLNTDEYEVTVVGKEKVNSYNATHVKVRMKNTGDVQDMWVSSEVPAYTEFQSVKSKYTGKANLYKALEAKGAGGFPVRIMAKQNGSSMQLDLVKAEKKNLDKSLFSLDGYAQGGLIPGMNGTIDLSIMKDIQNMSADEQRKAMEQLLKQFQTEEK